MSQDKIEQYILMSKDRSVPGYISNLIQWLKICKKFSLPKVSCILHKRWVWRPKGFMVPKWADKNLSEHYYYIFFHL